MRIDRTLSAMAAIFLASLPAAGAYAQSSDNGPPLGGPAVSGVCLLSREAILANAKVGKAASARLKQLADQAQGEIDAERKPVDADVQAYRSQAASLSADQRQSREQALAQRMQKVQADQNLRAREIEATRIKALGQIAQYEQSVITDSYRSKGCGLLLDRNTVIGGNMANDLTPLVVQGLDAKVTTLSFNLEQLPANGGASGGAQP
ncbi:OmpH family outer membrane protein [Dyella choica]|uniref:OmpH family outer membrane protein n=1 Tax=Dyella choica TaxID=1927959 RepID=A0A3S0S9T7_9GAMM|nr:OmpH family outer membrane protein [Dyella choica]RUL75238.1 OmpH family outer membrane protein [Dyella choica]